MGKAVNGGRKPKLIVVGGNGATRPRGLSRRPPPVHFDDLPTRIYFSRASSTPTGGSLTVLRKYAEWLARSRTRALYVVGHANLRLKGKAALALADARARAVRDLLVWLGARRGQVRRMTPSRMHQIRSDSTRSARAANRAVAAA
ncbi:MAG: OmpA family protein [Gammaproteobacteria bacterium]|nr:OmpA family protein [Gammaproteobacteria bacterium]